MNKVIYIILTIASLIIYRNAHSIGNDSIISWRVPHFPPYVITSGGMDGLGIDDLIKEDAASCLSDFKHFYQNSNYARALHDIKSKKPVLITPLFKTPEREKFVLYSAIASYLVLPNGFIINRSEKARFEPYLDQNGELDIEGLINSEKLSVGINLGRSYSGVLDEMIQKYPEAFHAKGATDLLGPSMMMLKANRIDAMLGFPVEVKYYAIEVGTDFHEFEVIPVSGMVSYSAVYFGAPNNEWGKKVINELNKHLLKDGTISQYIKYYESWLSDDSEIARYRVAIEDYYGTKYPEIYKKLLKERRLQ